MWSVGPDLDAKYPERTLWIINLRFKTASLLFSHLDDPAKIALVHVNVPTCNEESERLHRDANEEDIGVAHVCREILNATVHDAHERTSGVVADARV